MTDDWEDIDSAPSDGTIVRVVKDGGPHKLDILRWAWPLPARYVDGVWCAEFGPGEWAPFGPQPTHWKPMDAPVSAPLFGPRPPLWSDFPS